MVAEDIKTDQSSGTGVAAGKSGEKAFWCNFCGYESDDINEYLAHSCRDVIEGRGETIPEPSGNACK